MARRRGCQPRRFQVVRAAPPRGFSVRRISWAPWRGKGKAKMAREVMFRSKVLSAKVRVEASIVSAVTVVAPLLEAP